MVFNSAIPRRVGHTPMTSVKKADANATRIVTVTKNMVGPPCVEPVLLASHNMAHLTGSKKKIVQPTQMNVIHNAVNPECALMSVIHRARRIQPTISFPTPAESTTMPTVVSRSLSSVRIRHRTGKAVIENTTAVKSIKSVNLMLVVSMKV